MQRWSTRWKWLVIFGLLFTIIYFGLRLLNLTKLPIFTDEAIYIRWSQIGARDANWRFISLTDGKQPLFTWIMMVFLRLIPGDPLLIGRLVSVGAGLFTMLGVGFLSWELFKSKKIVLFACGLYLISPFTLMYDRMALYDSLVATFYIWNFYFAILLARNPRLDLALILGLSLGAGMLNKSSGFLSLYLLPTTLILFPWGKQNIRRLLHWSGLILISALLSQIVYSVLRLSPLLHMVGQKDTIFIYPFREWLAHPLRFLEGNLKGLFDWLISYLTKPVFLAALLPLVVFWQMPLRKILLFVWWFAPFLALALFGRVLYPRFILFMSLPLLILAALSLNWLWLKGRKIVLGIIAGLVIIVPSLYIDYFILTNPLYAPIPISDRTQYLEDWPSGWGIKEVNQFLLSQAGKSKIAVFTEGTFGLLPYSLEIYLVDHPNVKIKSLWPLPKEFPAEILAQASQQPTYFLTNESQEIPAGWPLKLILSVQKGTRSDRHLRLFEVLPKLAKRV